MDNKFSLFTVSAFVAGDARTGNPPSWEIIWEGPSFPDMLLELGAAKSRYARVRLDWRESDACGESD